MPRAVAPAPARNERALVARDNYQLIKGDLEERADEFADLLASRADADRFLTIGLRALAKTPDLLTGTRNSIVTAFFDAAQLKLEPVLGRVYFVKYGNTVTLLIGYGGYIDLARRSGEIASIYARVVYEGDRYEVVYGTEQKIVHVPAFKTSDPTKITDAYAVVKYRDGTIDFEPMTREEIEKIRARSRSGNSGPWITDYAEMCKKTPVRRLAKRLPLTIEVQQAIEADDEREFGGPAARSGTGTSAARERLKERLGVGGQDDEAADDDAIEGEAREVAPDESAGQQNDDLTAQDEADLDRLADEALGPKR